MFGLKSDTNDKFYLDEVSVVDFNAPGTELLMNPSFEDSTSSITDWSVWCDSGCSSEPVQIATNSNCYVDPGNCIESRCDDVNVETLVQTFTTTPGEIYTISFQLRQSVSSGLGGNEFYLDIQ